MESSSGLPVAKRAKAAREQQSAAVLFRHLRTHADNRPETHKATLTRNELAPLCAADLSDSAALDAVARAVAVPDADAQTPSDRLWSLFETYPDVAWLMASAGHHCQTAADWRRWNRRVAFIHPDPVLMGRWLGAHMANPRHADVGKLLFVWHDAAGHGLHVDPGLYSQMPYGNGPAGFLYWVPCVQRAAVRKTLFPRTKPSAAPCRIERAVAAWADSPIECTHTVKFPHRPEAGYRACQCGCNPADETDPLLALFESDE